jgi:hypothetical protein
MVMSPIVVSTTTDMFQSLYGFGEARGATTYRLASNLIS